MAMSCRGGACPNVTDLSFARVVGLTIREIDVNSREFASYGDVGLFFAPPRVPHSYGVSSHGAKLFAS